MSYSEDLLNMIIDQVEESLPQIRKETEKDFNFIINELNQTSSLFNFSFMRLFLSHSPAKRAALLAV